MDDDELIGAVAVALGHATDNLTLGRVADAVFPTPAAAGVWLRTAPEEKRRWALALWRTAALVLGALCAAAALWLLFGR